MTSSDPAVFEIAERDGWLGTTRAVGEAWIEARHGRAYGREGRGAGAALLERGPLEQSLHGGRFDVEQFVGP